MRLGLKIGIVLAGVCIFFIAGCGKESPFCIRGRGEIKYDFLSMYPFESINLNIDANVYISEGNGQQVKVVAKSNVIRNLNTTVEGGMWTIEYYRCVKNADSVAIYISIPDIKMLRVSTASTIYCTDLEQKELVSTEVNSNGGEIHLRDITLTK